MLNAKVFSIDDEDRAAFQKVIDGLEEEMYRRQIAIVRSMVIGINVLVIVAILGGCQTAKQSLNLGKAIGQDGAWILGKMSDNIQTAEK